MSDDFTHLADQLRQGITPAQKKALFEQVVSRVEQHIIAEMPEQTGDLKRKIRHVINDDGAEIEFYSDHAVFVHEPTRPHIIEAKHAHALVFFVGGKKVFAVRVHHPGTPGNPFIHRGLNAAMPEIEGLLEATGYDFLGTMVVS